MPVSFGASIFFALVALFGSFIYWGFRLNAKEEKGHSTSHVPYAGLLTGSLWGLCFLFLAISCVTQVTTKNVGVVTSFGRPIDTLSNGLHLKAPWHKVTEFDAAVQTDSHKGTGSDDASPCTDIRIGNQSVACLNNSIRWRIVQDSADDLYRDYREFDNVRDSLVTRELDAALNEVFASYDPLATVDTNGKSTAKSLDDLSEEVTARLRLKVGDQVEVLSVIIPLVSFDKTTQDKINDYQAELANTRIAKQRQQTANAEAEANRKLSGSVSNDPNVLVSKCFDTLKDMVRAKQQIPAGFSCWPGGGSSVVIPSAKG